MTNRSLNVINLSDHDLKIVGTYGDDLENVTVGDVVKSSQKTPWIIGDITEPSIFTPSHWDWIYLEDMVNHSQIELFAYVDNQAKNKDRAGAGWRSWNSGGSRDPNKGIRISDPCLTASHDDGSFTFTVGKIPADSYMFNMGRYNCWTIGQEYAADHVFVIVRDYNGGETFYFDSYGGHGEHEQSRDPCRVSCRGGNRSLRLAKAICCLNPDASRCEFDSHEGGNLGNGDSSGILYGWTGVCHQMANRIFAAGLARWLT